MKFLIFLIYKICILFKIMFVYYIMIFIYLLFEFKNCDIIIMFNIIKTYIINTFF